MPLFYINLFFTLPLCAKTSSVVLLMLSQTMKEKIELHFENLKESNSYYKDVFSRQVDKFQVGTWIHNCLYLVQHTPIHLVEAKCKAESLGHDELAKFYETKIAEEKGHDQWGHDDLDKLNQKAPSYPLCDSMIRIVEHNHRMIQEDPHLYLAHIYLAEYFTVIAAPTTIDALQKNSNIDPQCLSIFGNHAELDKEHVQEWEDIIAKLVDSAKYEERFHEFLEVSMAGYYDFCEEVSTYPKARELKVKSLPNQDGWKMEKPFIEKLSLGKIESYMVGLQATHPMLGDVTASAVAQDQPPEEKAWFELMERIGIVRAMASDAVDLKVKPFSGDEISYLSKSIVFPSLIQPETTDFQHSKSNGIALHNTWENACRHAAYEAIERHFVLSTWLGTRRPRILKKAEPKFESLSGMYEVCQVEFGSTQVPSIRERVYSCGVFLLPRMFSSKKKVPFVFGCGGHGSLKEALDKAEREALQRLSFLWGEDIPMEEPSFSPDPLYHQELYLWPKKHQMIKDWIQGRYFEEDTSIDDGEIDLAFVDLSEYSLNDEHFIAKAFSEKIIPLVFGKPEIGPFKGLDTARKVHPIA